MFTSTTDELAGEQVVPLTMAVSAPVVPPMTLHADTPDGGVGDGDVGDDPPPPPPQPAETDAASTRHPTVARSLLRT
jgi:hypothetical protein